MIDLGPWAFVSLVLVGIGTAVGGWLWRLDQVRGWHRRVDPAIECYLEPFRRAGQLTSQDFAGLMRYFVEGFVARRSPLGASAAYPGWPSGEGTVESRKVDQIEGYSRLAPLLGAWLGAGRAPVLDLYGNRRCDLQALLADGILAGTDAGSEEYWGEIGDFDQRIVEAADIALAIWLSRGSVWSRFSTVERARVTHWLEGATMRVTVDNNWHLFVVLIECVLDALDQPREAGRKQRRFERVKMFYQGGGWFSDGPEGSFDYYNAWGFHYTLFWIRLIQPDFESSFIDQARKEFAARFKYFFGPYGFPVFGRSLCYRMAAPAPLVAAANLDPEVVAPGEARRALDLTWSYFIRRGAVRDGNMTQGYFESDQNLLDCYSGPASCLWSLRSLVVAFWLPDDAPFWSDESSPLPVEVGDFDFSMEPLPFRLVGTREDGDIRLVRANPSTGIATPPLVRLTRIESMANFLLYRGRRPSNDDAKYLRNEYSSLHPFCVRSHVRPKPKRRST